MESDKIKKQGKKAKVEGSKLEKENKELLVVIRISGMVKVKKDIADTLDRLRLRRKYSCILVDSSNKNILGMLEKIKHYVAYGPINKEILVKLIKLRAKAINKNKKINEEEIAEQLIKGKKLKDLELKPFFRLHPPRKGIKSKFPYPKGVLGNNKEDINKLVERML